MKLIEPSLIVPRLRVAIENLFTVSNQVAYFGCVCPSALLLATQMRNRLYTSIEDLSRAIEDLEPKKVDTGCLTLKDALTLAGYAEIKRGLLRSWQFIESREQAIISRQ